ncbi:hypothetical protein ACVOMT_05905 [Sphingomonas panni]
MSVIDDPARRPHPEQVKNRMNAGWPETEAKNTPIRKITKKDGSPNIAEAARQAEKAPSDAQRLVRLGLSMDEAVARAKD